MEEVNDDGAARVCVGYNPWVVDEMWDGGQLLIAVFVDEEGMMIVRVSRREYTWDTWSMPLEARHG